MAPDAQQLGTQRVVAAGHCMLWARWSAAVGLVAALAVAGMLGAAAAAGPPGTKMREAERLAASPDAAVQKQAAELFLQVARESKQERDAVAALYNAGTTLHKLGHAVEAVNVLREARERMTLLGLSSVSRLQPVQALDMVNNFALAARDAARSVESSHPADAARLLEESAYAFLEASSLRKEDVLLRLEAMRAFVRLRSASHAGALRSLLLPLLEAAPQNPTVLAALVELAGVRGGPAAATAQAVRLGAAMLSGNASQTWSGVATGEGRGAGELRCRLHATARRLGLREGEAGQWTAFLADCAGRSGSLSALPAWLHAGAEGNWTIRARSAPWPSTLMEAGVQLRASWPQAAGVLWDLSLVRAVDWNHTSVGAAYELARHLREAALLQGTPAPSRLRLLDEEVSLVSELLRRGVWTHATQRPAYHALPSQAAFEPSDPTAPLLQQQQQHLLSAPFPLDACGILPQPRLPLSRALRAEDFYAFRAPRRPDAAALAFCSAPATRDVASLALALEENFLALRAEVEALLETPEAHVIRDGLGLVRAGEWTQLPLIRDGRRPANDRLWTAALPSLASLLARFAPLFAQMPGGAVEVSRLAPGTHVRAHCGPYSHRWRLHLPLRVPPAGAAIRVAADVVQWREGKVFLFDDSFEHEVLYANQSDAAWSLPDVDGDPIPFALPLAPPGDSALPRTVLLIDVWHPLLQLPASRDRVRQDLRWAA
jgi:hypothetical protein